jgi:DNA-binding transcriptional ArsR family regulator
MEMTQAVTALSALALEARLAIFRRLVEAGPEGLKAGEVAAAVGGPLSTLSANLSVLSHAGLIEGRRQGRAIIYAARYDRMRDLLDFLMEDCCGGNPQICAPVCGAGADA